MATPDQELKTMDLTTPPASLSEQEVASAADALATATPKQLAPAQSVTGLSDVSARAFDDPRREEPRELINQETVQRSIQFVSQRLGDLWQQRTELSRRSVEEVTRLTGITKQLIQEVGSRIQSGVTQAAGTAPPGTLEGSGAGLWRERHRTDAARRVAFNRLRVVLEHDRVQLTEDVLERIREDLLDVLGRYLTLTPEQLTLDVIAPALETNDLANEPPSITAHVKMTGGGASVASDKRRSR
jgi:cell division topological specificity factor